MPRFDKHLLDKIRRIVQLGPLIVAAVAGLVVGLAERMQTHLPEWVPEVPHLTLIIVGLLALELFLEQVEINHRLAKLEATDTERQINELGRRDRKRVRRAVEDYVKMCALKRRTRRTNPAFGKICDEILFEQTSGLHGLGEGKLYVPAGQLALAQRRLMDHYRGMFQAVSQNDLRFWFSQESAHYETVIRDAIRENQTVVSRIFVLDIYQFESYAEELARVLNRHFMHGVAWGVVIIDEHIAELHDVRVPLDFGIFDGGQAVTFFRSMEGDGFEGVFLTPQTREEIRRYKAQFAQLVGLCCFVNSAFAALYPGSLADAAPDITPRISRTTRNVAALVGRNGDPGAAPYFALASDHTEILPKLRELRDQLKGVRKPGFALPLRPSSDAG